MTRATSLVVVLVLLVVAAGGVAVYGGFLTGPTPPPTIGSTPPPHVLPTVRESTRPTGRPRSSPTFFLTPPPVQASPTPFDTNVHASAVVVPQRSADLAMSVSGVVSAIYVHVNETVGVGQLLLKLDQATYLRAIDVAEAAVTRGEAAVDRATLAVAQLPTDAPTGEIESAQAELRLAQADLQLAKSELTQAETDLRQTELRAPIAGTIAAIAIASGEQVDAGETIATIGDFSAWLLETTDVSELEVVRVAVGDRATATLTAIPGQVLTGHVDSIELRGTTDNGGIPVFTVTIRPDVTLPQLRWNMSANVSIEPSS